MNFPYSFINIDLKEGNKAFDVLRTSSTKGISEKKGYFVVHLNSSSNSSKFVEF